ncbi:MAG: tol-pal system protein YbgF [Rhodanobacter sp.]|nr:MAG: tol-pal system protein YbgF [Rhodanobacter sp.]TAL90588.1 MAG: tol-pal system protein YbgF [Rhodanobacter sp.]TAM41457.1 MAG: tol-pal system protein YbgF [Rhodanobacter sp.]TAN29376.1 MAG: tol-pal system protein YbgF [Rhodanobacter sp.]
MAGAIASAMLFAYPAFAQDSRLSLADRVTRLEQQAQSRDQGGTGLVNQIQQLSDQMRQLQGQVEELQHQLQVLNDKNKAQYADLDARLARLEGGGAGNTGRPQAQAVNPAAATTATLASSQPAAAASSGGVADPVAAQAAYDTAFQSIRAGNYVAASREFRSFIQQYPNHALVPNAWYWLGQSYFVTTNYAVALDAFKHLVAQYPQSDKLPDALLKVGYCQIELKQTAAAKATLKQVIAKYPGSDSASLAQERLQRLQLQSGS